MARTKRVKRETRKLIASFSFINRPSYGWDVGAKSFHFERGPVQANPISVEKHGNFQAGGSSTSVTLYSVGEGGSSVTSIDFVVMDPARVLVQSHHDPKNISNFFSARVTVNDGDEIILVDNPRNPPLTKEEVDQIYRYILKYRETCALQYSHDELWNKIVKMLGKTTTSPNDLVSLYTHVPSDYRCRPPVWFQLYDPLVPDCPDGNSLRKMVQNKPFIVHAYWRALDREPGGNAAYLTIRYVFRLYPNQPHFVQLEVARNWDRENEMEGPFTPVAVREESNDQSTLYSNIVALLLRQSNQINGTFHVVDEISRDRDAYDTEWSSVELLVFTTEHLDLRKVSSHLRQQAVLFLLCLKRQHKVALPLDLICRILSFLAPPRLIFRLHQQCIMGPQY